MFDELWSEIQDMQGEIFDIPDEVLEEMHENDDWNSHTKESMFTWNSSRVLDIWRANPTCQLASSDVGSH